MKQVFSVPLDQDLSGFTQFLWQQEVPHRVIETDTAQELWVAHGVDGLIILQLFERWQQGDDLSQYRLVRHEQPKMGFVATLRKAPLTTLLLGLALFVSLITGFGGNVQVLSYFTFTDIFLQGDNLYTRGLLYNVEALQLWRFITPVLIHFSLPHLIFNALWIWIVGTRIEILQGRVPLVGLVLLSGLLSNAAQYWVSGPMFGGLSGVVFAFLGYAWLWDRCNPAVRFGLPSALMGFMLLWLVLGYTGALEGMGLGAIANTAHLVGMLAGLVFVPIVRFFIKR